MMPANTKRLTDIEITQLSQAMLEVYEDCDDQQMAFDSETYAFWLNDMDDEYARMYRAEFDTMKQQ